MRKVIIAAFAAAVCSIGFAGGASAGGRCAVRVAPPPCVAPVVRQHRPTHRVRRQAPVQHVPRHAVRPARHAPAPCQSACAIDLRATYIDCVIRDGRQVWRYRAENGVVYNMSMQRRAERDRIRLFPDGHVEWVAVAG